MPGFQMSFGAVFSLFLTTALIKKYQKDKKTFRLIVMHTVLTTLVVSLATLPMVLHTFHRMPLYTLCANIIAIPFVNMLVMPLIILSLPFWIYGSAGCFVSFIGKAMTLLVQWASCFSGSFIAAPPAPTWAIILCVMGGVGLIYMQHHRGGALPLCLYILGCCGLFMGRPPDVFLSHNWPFVGLYAQKTLFIPYDV